MRMISTLALSLIAGLLFSGTTLADVTVEVSLSDSLEKYVGRIDLVEQKREALFRIYQDDLRLHRTRTERRFANSLYYDVKWANQQLIPDAAGYGVKQLIAALVTEDLKRAGLESESGKIRVHVKSLRVANHSIARLSGFSTYVIGTIALVDPVSGATVRSADISANLVVDPTVDRGYQGDDWAFPDTDPERRVGPALSYFVKKGLESLYPDRDFPKPVTITFSGVLTQLRDRDFRGLAPSLLRDINPR